jgi:quercetin dioxygenase-like cupin family protein
MKLHARKRLLLAALAVAALVVSGTAYALTLEPGSSQLLDGSVRAALAERLNVHHDGLDLQTANPNNDYEVVFQKIKYPAHSSSPWHTHPGFVVVLVQQGTVVHLDGCTPTTYTAGQAFHESGGVGTIENTTDQDAILYAAFVVPRGAPLRDTNVDAPSCG